MSISFRFKTASSLLLFIFFFLGSQQAAFAGYKFYQFEYNDNTAIEGNFDKLGLRWRFDLPKRSDKGYLLDGGKPAWAAWRGSLNLYGKIKVPYKYIDGEFIDAAPNAKFVIEELSLVDEKSGNPLEVYYGFFYEHRVPFSAEDGRFKQLLPGAEVDFAELKPEKLEIRVLGSFKIKKMRLKYRFKVHMPDGRSDVSEGSEILTVSSRRYKALS